MSATGEFDLIRRYFQRPQLQSAVPMALGPGDDCALLEVPPMHQLAVSADSLVADVHFLSAMPAKRIAQRCMAANLSDLAAMGAQPAWFTLCLTLPERDDEFLQGFSDGLVDMAQRYGISLAGGDTTRGPLAISIQVMGWVPSGQALMRKGAQVGDGIYVSGTLGDAAAGLLSLKQNIRADDYLAQRFYDPSPRLALGQWLRGKASAALDISDGLLQDLGHILQQSDVGASVDVAQLPLSLALRQACSTDEQLALALSGGEDFELCFTLNDEHASALIAYGQTQGQQITRIGTIEAEQGLRLTQSGAAMALPEQLGWQHF